MSGKAINKFNKFIQKKTLRHEWVILWLYCAMAGNLRITKNINLQILLKKMEIFCACVLRTLNVSKPFMHVFSPAIYMPSLFYR